MKTKLRLRTLSALLLLPAATSAQTLLLQYSFTGAVTTPTSLTANLSAGAFSGNLGSPGAGSSGPVFSAGSGGAYFAASAWTGTTNYFEFTVAPASGYQVSLSSLSFGYRATTTGPNAATFRSSADSYAGSLVTTTLTRDSTVWSSTGSLTLTSLTITTPTTFRIYGSGGSSAGGTFRVDDVTLYGSTSAIPEPSTYAAIAGAASLLGAMWWRRRQNAASRPAQ